MSKYFLIFTLLVASIIPTFAQQYGTALGLRGGNNQIGLTLQQRIAKRSTIEAIGTFNTKQYEGTALYEHHFRIGYKGLNYYFGAGGHIGKHRETGVYGGLNPAVGVEWKLPAFPLLISADLMPAFHINHNKSIEWNTAISIRYVIVTQRDLNRKKREKRKAERKEMWEDRDLKGWAGSWWNKDDKSKKKKQKNKKKGQEDKKKWF